MARHLRGEAGGKGLNAGFNVSSVAIERRQFLADVHDAQVYEAATCFCAVVLAGGHECRTKTSFLPLRVDRQEAQVSPIAPQFNVNTADENSVLGGDQEFSHLEQRPHRLHVDAIVINKEGLRPPESGVDDGGDGFRFLCLCDTHSHKRPPDLANGDYFLANLLNKRFAASIMRQSTFVWFSVGSGCRGIGGRYERAGTL